MVTCTISSLSSVYQVVVEEERPRRLRREPGGQDCFSVPLTFETALARGLVHYFGAELAASSLLEAMPFTVGDNQTYRGFWNPPLEPRKAYLIYFQAASHLKGVRSWLCPRGVDWGSGRVGNLWGGLPLGPETWSYPLYPNLLSSSLSLLIPGFFPQMPQHSC